MTDPKIVQKAIEIIEATPAEDIGDGFYYYDDLKFRRGRGEQPCCAVGHIHHKLWAQGVYIAMLDLENILDTYGGSSLHRVNDAEPPGEDRKEAVLDLLRKRLKELSDVSES